MLDINFLLAMGACYKKVAAGEIIFMEGSRCNFYYQLVSGRVNWLNINEDGKEYLQYVIGPGECFGELPLFDGEPYAASAIAQEDSVIIRLPQFSFHQLLAEQPAIHMAFSKLLAQRLRFKFFLLREFFYGQPVERIASLIAYFKETNHNICQSCGKIKLTRQQIANMTCLRVETVIRAMRQMHDRGEITIKKGKVYCRDINGGLHGKCIKDY